MSRHRNVRHLVAEEDYYDDDYDDDYYDDGYDDGYDDYQASTVQAPKAATSNNKANKATTPNKKPAPQQKNNPPNKSTPKKNVKAQKQNPTVSFDATTTATSTTTAPKSPGRLTFPSTASPPRPGVAAPPPGFSAAPPTTATTATATKSSAPPIPPVLLRDDNLQAKPTLTCVILGHVDAGKSTLTGQLLWANSQDPHAATAQHDNNNASANNTIPTNTNKRPPKNLAWLLDEDEQERQHGITMEVATKTLYTPHYRLVLQDAPGHVDYVPHMIAGTSSADAAVAVVDVTDAQHSALQRGQLREHVYLAKGLGVTQLIVALNKMDVLDWDEGQYRSFVQPLSNFLFQSVGFAKNKVQFVPISGLTGTNVYKDTVDCPALKAWYQGPTLWQAMQRLELPNPNSHGSGATATTPTTTTRRLKLLEKPLRLLLTDILQEQGKGVAVRARVVSGWLGCVSDARLTILPLGDVATVSKVVPVQETLVSTSSTSTTTTDYAVAGDWVDLVLSQVDVARLSVGHVLIRPHDTSLIPAARCRARIYVLEHLTLPIIRGTTAMFHIHSVQVPCCLSQLLKSCSNHTSSGAAAKENWREKPRALTKQTQAIVEITIQHTNTGILMEAFGDCRPLGRFVLRRGGESIAVGRIEQVLR